MLQLVYISCSIFPSYHSAVNSLRSPDALLLVETQQGRQFLNTAFLGQLTLLEYRQNISNEGKNNCSSSTPKSSSKNKIKWETALNKSAERKSHAQRAWRVVPRTFVTQSQYPVKPPSQPNPPWLHTLATPPSALPFCALLAPGTGTKQVLLEASNSSVLHSWNKFLGIWIQVTFAQNVLRFMTVAD